MEELKSLRNQIFKIRGEHEFELLAMRIFKFQSQQNQVYQSYLKHLNLDISKIRSIAQIPLLPIQFFKTHKVISSTKKADETFTSSGTTGMAQSRHFVSDINIYSESFLKGFSHFYGEIEDYCILALLPSYLERDGSSLVFMVDELIKKSKQPESGFYLNNHRQLVETINSTQLRNKKILLIGVSFALLELAEKFQINHPNLTVMETGGMKGRRKELIREELHKILTAGFNVEKIHSEYGMTELLSQAYSFGDGVFTIPPWMKVIIRDANDPFSYVENGKSGGINVIDLANINSCSFIMTQDLGRMVSENSFEVQGRFDASDIRGCNLLVD